MLRFLQGLLCRFGSHQWSEWRATMKDDGGKLVPWEPGLASKDGEKIFVDVVRRCPRCRSEQRFLAPADLWHQRYHLDHRLWPGGWQTYAIQMKEHQDGTSSS